jgi:hypothetical protein
MGGTMIGGVFIVLFGIRVLPLASIALLAVAGPYLSFGTAALRATGSHALNLAAE